MHLPLLLILSCVFCGIQLPLGPRERPHEKKPKYYQYNPHSKANIAKKQKYMNVVAPLDAAILSLRHELKVNFQILNWTIHMPTWFGQPRTVASSIRRLERIKKRLIMSYKLYRVFEPVP